MSSTRFEWRFLSCGEYIGYGKKFNSKKETVLGEEYLGIKIFRFYFKCTRCSSEITIKTDPENSDYSCENGATRNYESVIKDNERTEEQMRKKKEEEDGDAMKLLETRTIDNKIEMDILDGLDEIRSLNAQASKVNPMDILNKIRERTKEKDLTIDDEEKLILDRLKGSHKSMRLSIEISEDSEEDVEVVPLKQNSSKTTFVVPKNREVKKSKIGFEKKYMTKPQVAVTPPTKEEAEDPCEIEDSFSIGY